MKVVGREQMSLDDTSFRCLVDCYNTIYEINAQFKIPRSCWRSKQVEIDGNIFGSRGSRSERSSYITAFGVVKMELYNHMMYLSPRPGRITYFITHVIYQDDEPFEHVFAHIEWFSAVSQIQIW